MKIDHLIVATDLTNYASVAARWAHNIRQRLGADVVVTHVVEVSLVDWFSNAVDRLDDASLNERAHENLDTWYHDVTGESPDRIEVRVGSPNAQIRELIDELGGDCLVVAAMSGKGALSKFFLGSTVRTFVADPMCPVVIVHPDHEYPMAGNPIVAGTDFSENASKAIEFAIALGAQVESPLAVLHANPAPRVTVFDGGEIPIGLLRDSAAAWSKTRLAEVEKRLLEIDGLDFEVSMVQDEPAEALAAHAERNQADFIVVGHSGESRLTQAILGSVAQRLLNRMPTSLVIVPNS